MFNRMKLGLIYGAAMSIAGALFLLLLFFAGFHDSAEKMQSAQWLGLGGGVTISVICLALAMREKRAQFSPEEDWTYGSALGAGVLAGLFGSLFGMITSYCYFGIINPGFSDLVVQAQIAGMESYGMPAAQVEKSEPMLRKMASPVVMTLSNGFGGVVFSTLLSLVVAIFFRHRPVAVGGPEAPPPLD
jgi:hypothetical protein